MKKKYRAIIYFVACLSGLAIGVAIALASSGYIGLLNNSLNPPIGGFGYPSHWEELAYASWEWGPGNEYCNITIRNIVSLDATIAQVRIDNSTITPDTPLLPCTLKKDVSVTIKVAGTFISGMRYSFMVITARGNQFGPLSLIAP
jgi:hypothetical protein